MDGIGRRRASPPPSAPQAVVVDEASLFWMDQPTAADPDASNNVKKLTPNQRLFRGPLPRLRFGASASSEVEQGEV
jgi:hypothetical protein